MNQTVSAYAEDNWHILNRLSLQYGIRYDALPHAWERNNRLANFDPSQYQAGSAPTVDSPRVRSARPFRQLARTSAQDCRPIRVRSSI